MKQQRKLISFVFPIYNEAPNIPELFKQMLAVCESITPKFNVEFVFVNDGSRDNSIDVLREYQAKTLPVKLRILDFSRNFGHQIAVTAGIDVAEGDAVIVMDSDLQDPPAVALELIDRWVEGYQVVYAQRRTRKDTFFKRVTASAFYRVLDKLTEIEIPRNTGDFRLLDRAVVAQLRKMNEQNRFLRGMVSYLGFRQIAVPFDRDARLHGETGYPLRKMIRFAADGILSFSTQPLKVITRFGVLASLISLLGIIYVLFMKLFFPDALVAGWAFTVLAILFMGGMNLLMLGIVGSYVGRIYTETQRRPLYVLQPESEATTKAESTTKSKPSRD
jgi:glycosyltransferase involved in cell wall biosynthesis